MGSIITSVADAVALILLFGVTIFVHELGHFLTALACGMVVDTFSIGFGPPIWQKRVRGILFKVAWFPFGGYVALPQLDPSGMAAVQGKNEGAGDGDAAESAADGDAEAGRKRELPPVSPWKKILVSVSGATGNVIFAVVLAWVVFLSPEGTSDDNGGRALIGFVDTNSVAYARGVRPGNEIVAVNGESVSSWNEYAVLCLLGTGRTNAVTLSLREGEAVQDVRVPTMEGEMGVNGVDGIGQSLACMIAGVREGGSAAAAGLESGDIVRMFDGKVVASTQHFQELVARRGGETVPIVVERAGELLERQVTPAYSTAAGKPVIGVEISSDFGRMVMPWMQYRRPWDQIRNDAAGIVRILKALLTPREAGQAAKGLGGPVMIIAALWVSIKISWLNAIGFLRFLNVNLAILNLLPIPVLDGGHIIFSLWEGVTRRRVHPKVVNTLVNVFAVLLIGILLLLSFRDIIRAPRLLRAFGLIGGDEAAVEEVEADGGTNRTGQVDATP